MSGRRTFGAVFIAGSCLATSACLNLPFPRATSEVAAMNNERLQTLIEGLGAAVEGELGYWSLTLESRQIVVMTDTAADRMRIMTPVAEESELDVERMRILLEANFDRALDARYAVARGYIWSVFIHPMSPLTEQQFIDGLGQVITLADTYGTSYTSSGLVFQGGQN